MAGKQVSVRLEPPRLILITGPASTGKTTLSHILARRIGCPMISRNEIKEGIFLNTPGFEPAAGDPLTVATLAVFFDALTLLLRAGVTLVGEAAFQDHVWRNGLDRIDVPHTVRTVECACDPTVLVRRQAERREGDVVHARAHPHTTGRAEWIGLTLPKLAVDTSDGYRPDLGEVADYALG
ncbi:MAG TPA: AAA family ATPase [Micromonosporaceae bacterium]|jgi:predicted kinase